MDLKRFTIAKKMLVGFIIFAFITLAIGIFSYSIAKQTLDRMNKIVTEDVAFQTLSQRLQYNALQHRRFEKDFFLHIGNTQQQTSYIKKFNEVSKKTDQILTELEDLIQKDRHLGPKTLAIVNSAKSSLLKYRQGFLSLNQRVQGDKIMTPQKANAMMLPLKSDIYTFESNIDKIFQKSEEMLSEIGTENSAYGKKYRNILAMIIFSGFILSVVMAAVISKIITLPVKRSVKFAQNIAKGDFTENTTVNRNDEVGDLINALNHMSQNLKHMVKDINQSTGQLFTSASDLNEISSDLTTEADQTTQRSLNVSRSAENMTSNLSGVVSAMEQSSSNASMVASAAEEMTATINEIAQNSEKARLIASDAVSQAGRASDSMNELGKAAYDIGKVTETITEISEQTNLLALNATIEAARAGEAGKGFAVVANEIKELAKQTADATLDIKSKISGVQTTTQSTVDEINDVTNIINNINDIVNTIATSVEEQSASTQEIAQNIAQTSSGIQDINENVNQSSSTAENISNDISGVNQSSQNISKASVNIKSSAKDLIDLSNQLKERISEFTI